MRLITIARQCNVEVLGVGAIPPKISIEQLSGVRLVSNKDLSAEAARLLSAAAVERTASPSEPPLTEELGTYTPTRQTIPMPGIDEKIQILPNEEEPQDVPEQPQEEYRTPRPDAAQNPSLGELLSAEEIEALLRFKRE